MTARASGTAASKFAGSLLWLDRQDNVGGGSEADGSSARRDVATRGCGVSLVPLSSVLSLFAASRNCSKLSPAGTEPVNVLLEFEAAVDTRSIVPLDIAAAERAAFAPDLPTVAEGGIDGSAASSCCMLLAPAGTPQGIVDRLSPRSAGSSASRP